MTVPLRVRVNGELHTVNIDPRTSLLDLLRECLALTGAKKVATMDSVVPVQFTLMDVALCRA